MSRGGDWRGALSDQHRAPNAVATSFEALADDIARFTRGSGPSRHELTRGLPAHTSAFASPATKAAAGAGGGQEQWEDPSLVRILYQPRLARDGLGGQGHRAELDLPHEQAASLGRARAHHEAAAVADRAQWLLAAEKYKEGIAGLSGSPGSSAAGGAQQRSPESAGLSLRKGTRTTVTAGGARSARLDIDAAATSSTAAAPASTAQAGSSPKNSSGGDGHDPRVAAWSTYKSVLKLILEDIKHDSSGSAEGAGAGGGDWGQPLPEAAGGGSGKKGQGAGRRGGSSSRRRRSRSGSSRSSYSSRSSGSYTDSEDYSGSGSDYDSQVSGSSYTGSSYTGSSGASGSSYDSAEDGSGSSHGGRRRRGGRYPTRAVKKLTKLYEAAHGRIGDDDDDDEEDGGRRRKRGSRSARRGKAAAAAAGVRAGGGDADAATAGSQVAAAAAVGAAAAAAAGARKYASATTLYAFSGLAENGELSFDASQTVLVLDTTSSADWWYGEVDGRRGWFPRTYVGTPVEATEVEGEGTGAAGGDGDGASIGTAGGEGEEVGGDVAGDASEAAGGAKRGRSGAAGGKRGRGGASATETVILRALQTVLENLYKSKGMPVPAAVSSGQAVADAVAASGGSTKPEVLLRHLRAQLDLDSLDASGAGGSGGAGAGRGRSASPRGRRGTGRAGGAGAGGSSSNGFLVLGPGGGEEGSLTPAGGQAVGGGFAFDIDSYGGGLIGMPGAGEGPALPSGSPSRVPLGFPFPPGSFFLPGEGPDGAVTTSHPGVPEQDATPAGGDGSGDGGEEDDDDYLPGWGSASAGLGPGSPRSPARGAGGLGSPIREAGSSPRALPSSPLPGLSVEGGGVPGTIAVPVQGSSGALVYQYFAPSSFDAKSVREGMRAAGPGLAPFASYYRSTFDPQSPGFVGGAGGGGGGRGGRGTFLDDALEGDDDAGDVTGIHDTSHGSGNSNITTGHVADVTHASADDDDFLALGGSGEAGEGARSPAAGGRGGAGAGGVAGGRRGGAGVGAGTGAGGGSGSRGKGRRGRRGGAGAGGDHYPGGEDEEEDEEDFDEDDDEEYDDEDEDEEDEEDGDDQYSRDHDFDMYDSEGHLVGSPLDGSTDAGSSMRRRAARQLAAGRGRRARRASRSESSTMGGSAVSGSAGGGPLGEGYGEGGEGLGGRAAAGSPGTYEGGGGGMSDHLLHAAEAAGAPGLVGADGLYVPTDPVLRGARGEGEGGAGAGPGGAGAGGAGGAGAGGAGGSGGMVSTPYGVIDLPAAMAVGGTGTGASTPYQIVTQAGGRRVKILVMGGEELWELFRPKLRGFAAAFYVFSHAVPARRATKAWVTGGLVAALEAHKARRRATLAFTLGLCATLARHRKLAPPATKAFAVGFLLRTMKIEAKRREDTGSMGGARASASVLAAVARAGAQLKKSATAAKEALDPFAPKTRAIHWDAVTNVEDTIWARGADGISSSALDMERLMPDLINRFTDKPAEKGAKAEGGAAGAGGTTRAPTTVTLLDPDSSRKLGITLTTVVGKRSMDDIKRAVTMLDHVKLGGLEKVEAMGKVLSSISEEARTKIKAYDGDPAKLALPERFIREVVFAVDNLPVRIAVMELQLTADASVSGLRQQLTVVDNTTSEVRTSPKLATLLLDVILPLGNKLNAMSRKGTAAGFKISSLNKLVLTKSATGETFLRFIAEGLIEQQPALLQVADEFPTLMRAKGQFVDFATVRQEISRLERGVRQVQILVSKVEKGGEGPPVEELRALHDGLTKACKELGEELNAVTENFADLCRFLGEDPARTEPRSLFEHFSVFFGSLTKEAAEVRTKLERQRKAEARKAGGDVKKAGTAAAGGNRKSLAPKAAAAAAAAAAAPGGEEPSYARPTLSTANRASIRVGAAAAAASTASTSPDKQAPTAATSPPGGARASMRRSMRPGAGGVASPPEAPRASAADIQAIQELALVSPAAATAMAVSMGIALPDATGVAAAAPAPVDASAGRRSVRIASITRSPPPVPPTPVTSPEPVAPSRRSVVASVRLPAGGEAAVDPRLAAAVRDGLLSPQIAAMAQAGQLGPATNLFEADGSPAPVTPVANKRQSLAASVVGSALQAGANRRLSMAVRGGAAVAGLEAAMAAAAGSSTSEGSPIAAVADGSAFSMSPVPAPAPVPSAGLGLGARMSVRMDALKPGSRMSIFDIRAAELAAEKDPVVDDAEAGLLGAAGFGLPAPAPTAPASHRLSRVQERRRGGGDDDDEDEEDEEDEEEDSGDEDTVAPLPSMMASSGSRRALNTGLTYGPGGAVTTRVIPGPPSAPPPPGSLPAAAIAALGAASKGGSSAGGAAKQAQAGGAANRPLSSRYPTGGAPGAGGGGGGGPMTAGLGAGAVPPGPRVQRGGGGLGGFGGGGDSGDSLMMENPSRSGRTLVAPAPAPAPAPLAKLSAGSGDPDYSEFGESSPDPAGMGSRKKADKSLFGFFKKPSGRNLKS